MNQKNIVKCGVCDKEFNQTEEDQWLCSSCEQEYCNCCNNSGTVKCNNCSNGKVPCSCTGGRSISWEEEENLDPCYLCESEREHVCRECNGSQEVLCDCEHALRLPDPF